MLRNIHLISHGNFHCNLFEYFIFNLLLSAVQLRLIFGYYKLVANSRSRPHWPWYFSIHSPSHPHSHPSPFSNRKNRFVQNILDMAKSSIRNEKLVEMALLFLWGEVCGEAMPEDLLNVAHKPVSILLFCFVCLFVSLSLSLTGESRQCYDDM
jgi:hypothetical protein